MTTIHQEHIVPLPIQNCPLCGSDKFKFILREQNNFSYSYAKWSYLNLQPVHIARCKYCTFAFTAALPPLFFFEDILYDTPATAHQWPSADAITGKEYIFSCIFKLLKRYKCGDTLLDLGACSGRFLYLARSHFTNLYGIENDPRAVSIAEKSGIKIHQGAILKNLPKFNNQPDVITLIDVLEHLPSPKEHLHAIHTALKQRGLLYVKVPHQSGQLYKEKLISFLRLRPTSMATNFVHINHFSERSLISVLESIGYRIEHVQIAQPELYPWQGIHPKHRLSNYIRMAQYKIARAIRALFRINLGLNLEILARKI